MAKYSWLVEQLLSFDTDHKYFHKDKIIIIINGYGKSGKDYLVDRCVIDHTSISSISRIKEIARYAMSDEAEVTDKTIHYRNFLHDLKNLCDKYYDTSLRYLIDEACIFLRSDTKILFVFISELEKIEEFKKHMLPYVATYSLFVTVPKEICKKHNICYDDPRFGLSTQKEIEELIQHHDYIFSNKFDTFSIAAFNTLITCIYDDSKLHRDEEQSIPLHKVHLCIIYDSLHLFHNNGDADIKEDIYFNYNRNGNTSNVYDLFHIDAKFILNKEECKYDLDNSRSEFDYEYIRNDVKKRIHDISNYIQQSLLNDLTENVHTYLIIVSDDYVYYHLLKILSDKASTMLNEWSHANQLEITAYRQINAWINKDFVPKQGEFRNVKLAPLINDDLVRSKSTCLIDYSFKAYHQLLEIIFSNPIYD